jgi:hypothetical protein
MSRQLRQHSDCCAAPDKALGMLSGDQHCSQPAAISYPVLYARTKYCNLVVRNVVCLPFQTAVCRHQTATQQRTCIHAIVACAMCTVFANVSSLHTRKAYITAKSLLAITIHRVHCHVWDCHHLNSSSDTEPYCSRRAAPAPQTNPDCFLKFSWCQHKREGLAVAVACISVPQHHAAID